MEWEAHSFLCISPDAVLTRRVQAIAGFRWGFGIAGGEIGRTPPAPLGPPTWDSHLGILRTSYPDWEFDAGYVAS
jgi:hypothetical protein